MQPHPDALFHPPAPVDRPSAAIVAGFAVVYVVWGTTYLGIALAVEEIPPLLMVAFRFLLAGGLMGLWVLARREWIRPTRVQLGWNSLVGLLMLAFGNASLSVAEQRMPSGVAALVVCTVPVWMVVLEAASQRRAPSWRVGVALAIALAGVALLSTEDAGWKGGVHLGYVFLIMGGSVGWATGSLLSRRHGKGLPLLQAVAIQALAGGSAMLLLGSARGEWASWTPADVSTSVWLWLAYLAVAGSILALTCYVWLLKRVSAGAVATYAFVNPIVAVAVGAAFASEPITLVTVGAAGLVVTAVVMILREQGRATDDAHATRPLGEPTR